MKFIINFGKDHKHVIQGRTYDKYCVAKIESPNGEAAIAKARQLFGDAWRGCRPLTKMAEDDVRTSFPGGILDADER